MVALVILAIINLAPMVFGLFSGPALGAGTRYPNGISADTTSPTTGQVRGTTLTVTGTATLGDNGSAIADLIHGTCSLVAYSGGFTVAATSTVAFDCAVTGALTTDTQVFAKLATSSVATSGGWTVEASSASSTPGYLRIHVRNNTGASAVMPASVASSTSYLIVR